MRWFKILGWMGLGLVCSGPAEARLSNWTLDLPGSEPGPGLSESFEQALDWERYFAKHPELKGLKLGVALRGAEPLARNAASPMLPASTEKLVTAALALRHLGRDYRFENRFSAKFDSSTGTLSEVKFLVSGDPTWSSGGLFSLSSDEPRPGPVENWVEQVDEPRFEKLIDGLLARGVRALSGPVRIESLRPDLDRIPRPAGWRESWKLECMAMMQTSFQSNGNCGTLAVSAGKARWVTRGVRVPLKVRVYKSRSGRNSVSITPETDSTGRIRSYVISGFIGRGTLYFDLPVHAGVDWLEALFIDALQSRGVAVLPVNRTQPTSGALEEIREDLSSEPLLKILTVAVQRSINGVMDRVFFELAMANGRSGSEVLSDGVRATLPDPALLEGVVFADGSGLDLRNRMRPDALHGFLSGMRSAAEFADFYSTLAVAGISGTLRSRPVLAGSPYTNGKIHAKTGTLTGIHNLAGYFEPAPGGGVEPFVVFTEGSMSSASARAALDGIVVNFAAQNSP
jgi:PBP4 family serine-type D-alanyl-D-alanine carboxypeptidase